MNSKRRVSNTIMAYTSANTILDRCSELFRQRSMKCCRTASSNATATRKWFEKEKISFNCTGCGKCCQGKPGHVWLLEEDLKNISVFLGMTKDEFISKHTRFIEEYNRFSLKEIEKENWRCEFLSPADSKTCTIYKHRPTQCRTYPYWPRVMSSSALWKQEAAACEVRFYLLLYCCLYFVFFSFWFRNDVIVLYFICIFL